MTNAEQRTPAIPLHPAVRTQNLSIVLGYAALAAVLLAIAFASAGPGTNAAAIAIAAGP